jgi:ribokinase
MVVIGVGDADIDIYLDVDRIPGRGEKLIAKNVELHPGGMVANFLVALARLGMDCKFHGPVGEDQFGQLSLDHLQQNDVDITDAVIKKHGATYFSLVMLDPSREKALIVAPTDCLYLMPDEISEKAISSAQHVHTTAIYEPTTTKVINLGKKHGLTVSLDIEPNQLSSYDAFRPLLISTDLVIVNHMAALPLTQKSTYEEALWELINLGSKVACITFGAEGSIITDGAQVFRVDAIPVEVVDSTGAGDCYAAGCVLGFLNQWPIETIVKYASAVSAISVGHRGGRSNTPSHQDVVDFLGKHGLPIKLPHL